MFFYAKGSSLNYLGIISGFLFVYFGFTYFLFPNALPSGIIEIFYLNNDSAADFFKFYIFYSIFSVIYDIKLKLLLFIELSLL